VLTLNGTADAKPTVYLTNITNLSGRVATWDVKGIQGTDGMISTFTLSSGTKQTLFLVLTKVKHILTVEHCRTSIF
ncbi:MAG: hypothetical protein IJF70_01555, partial [Opitutales bacterium]|nr:hypothetical protein [Opitutales bacterium]